MTTFRIQSFFNSSAFVSSSISGLDTGGDTGGDTGDCSVIFTNKKTFGYYMDFNSGSTALAVASPWDDKKVFTYELGNTGWEEGDVIIPGDTITATPIFGTDVSYDDKLAISYIRGDGSRFQYLGGIQIEDELEIKDDRYGIGMKLIGDTASSGYIIGEDEVFFQYWINPINGVGDFGTSESITNSRLFDSVLSNNNQLSVIGDGLKLQLYLNSTVDTDVILGGTSDISTPITCLSMYSPEDDLFSIAVARYNGNNTSTIYIVNYMHGVGVIDTDVATSESVPGRVYTISYNYTLLAIGTSTASPYQDEDVINAYFEGPASNDSSAAYIYRKFNVDEYFKPVSDLCADGWVVKLSDDRKYVAVGNPSPPTAEEDDSINIIDLSYLE